MLNVIMLLLLCCCCCSLSYAECRGANCHQHGWFE